MREERESANKERQEINDTTNEARALMSELMIFINAWISQYFPFEFASFFVRLMFSSICCASIIATFICQFASLPVWACVPVHASVCVSFNSNQAHVAHTCWQCCVYALCAPLWAAFVLCSLSIVCTSVYECVSHYMLEHVLIACAPQMDFN